MLNALMKIFGKGYYTNSYHVDVREKIDAFTKFKFESQFQKISSGGAISYVEIPNMKQNLDAMETVVRFIYDNIQYAEFNTKSDYCQVCGFDGEIIINDEGKLIGLDPNIAMIHKEKVVDMLVGNVIFASHDNDGNTIGLNPDQIIFITNHLQGPCRVVLKDGNELPTIILK